MEESHQNSFTAGLILGAISGVAGYYLFGTKEGRELREKIKQEWSGAQDCLQENLPQNSKNDIRNLEQLLSKAKKEILDVLEISQDEKQAFSSRPRKKRVYKKHRDQKKFAGV